MSDITTCPKCNADLNVSTAPGAEFVCWNCGYSAVKPLSPEPRRWRTVHYILLVLALVIGVPAILLLVVCAASPFNFGH